MLGEFWPHVSIFLCTSSLLSLKVISELVYVEVSSRIRCCFKLADRLLHLEFR